FNSTIYRNSDSTTDRNVSSIEQLLQM
ncbi:unnamed protein product, partial [Rotaria sordida]